jgi:hypothetical protein
VAAVLVVGVLAVIGVLGVWQRSEASDPQLGDAVVVKSTPSPSTPAETARPAGSSRADTSPGAGSSQRPAAGTAARATYQRRHQGGPAMAVAVEAIPSPVAAAGWEAPILRAVLPTVPTRVD